MMHFCELHMMITHCKAHTVCVCVHVRVPLTPGRHGVSLLQLPQVSQPRVLDDHRSGLQGVFPHRVLTLVPNLEGSVVTVHRLIHIDVIQLQHDRE